MAWTVEFCRPRIQQLLRHLTCTACSPEAAPTGAQHPSAPSAQAASLAQPAAQSSLVCAKCMMPLPSGQAYKMLTRSCIVLQPHALCRLLRCEGSCQADLHLESSVHVEVLGRAPLLQDSDLPLAGLHGVRLGQLWLSSCLPAYSEPPWGNQAASGCAAPLCSCLGCMML